LVFIIFSLPEKTSAHLFKNGNTNHLLAAPSALKRRLYYTGVFEGNQGKTDKNNKRRPSTENFEGRLDPEPSQEFGKKLRFMLGDGEWN